MHTNHFLSRLFSIGFLALTSAILLILAFAPTPSLFAG